MSKGRRQILQTLEQRTKKRFLETQKSSNHRQYHAPKQDKSHQRLYGARGHGKKYSPVSKRTRKT